MIECLNNLVGIRTSCGDQTVSDSGLYLQDLPFINLKVADAIVTDQNSGYALMESKLNIAQNFMIEDVRSRMLPYFKAHSVVENDIVGYTADNMIAVTSSGRYSGVQLKINEYPFLSVYISSISLFTDYTGDIPVKVFDLSQNKVVDTITVACVSGEITRLDIHKEYQTNGQTLNLLFAYDTTDINSYQTNVFNVGFIGAASCRGCARRRDTSNGYIYAYAKSLGLLDSAIDRNLQSENNTAGMSVTYSVSCSLDKWVCQQKNGFSMALLYRAGMEILKEFSMSNRVNSLVTLRKEEVSNLEQYFESEYKKSMDNALKNMRIPNDICFKCQKQIRTQSISV